MVVGNTISISNFNELNNGDYRCIVTNKLGQDTKTIYLQGQGGHRLFRNFIFRNNASSD